MVSQVWLVSKEGIREGVAGLVVGLRYVDMSEDLGAPEGFYSVPNIKLCYEVQYFDMSVEYYEVGSEGFELMSFDQVVRNNI